MSNLKISDQEMYSRQIIMKEVGLEGQKKIQESSVTIIGCGALGTVTAELMVRLGVHNLTIIDRDTIEISNLQRQSLYTLNDIGKTKVMTAKNRLLEINPNVNIKTQIIHLDNKNIKNLETPNLILDCTDNIKTRLLINDYAKKNKINWIYSAAIKTKGMIFPIFSEGPCLQCFLPQQPNTETCSTAGVLNTTTHIIAAMQTTLALRIILNKKEIEKELKGILHSYDSWENNITKIKINQKKSCQTCEGIYTYLDGTSKEQTEKFCSSGNYQIVGKKNINLEKLKKELEIINNKEITIKFDGVCLIISEQHKHLILFSDGRALIKTKSREQAETMYSKFVGN